MKSKLNQDFGMKSALRAHNQKCSQCGMSHPGKACDGGMMYKRDGGAIGFPPVQTSQTQFLASGGMVATGATVPQDKTLAPYTATYDSATGRGAPVAAQPRPTLHLKKGNGMPNAAGQVTGMADGGEYCIGAEIPELLRQRHIGGMGRTPNSGGAGRIPTRLLMTPGLADGGAYQYTQEPAQRQKYNLDPTNGDGTSNFPPNYRNGGFLDHDGVPSVYGYADGGQPHALAYIDGGGVDGPKGIDKVGPVMLSEGEYVLPKDTTAAIGKEKLDALKAKTHTPINVQHKGRGALRGRMQHRADGGPGWSPLVPTRDQMPPEMQHHYDNIQRARDPHPDNTAQLLDRGQVAASILRTGNVPGRADGGMTPPMRPGGDPYRAYQWRQNVKTGGQVPPPSPANPNIPGKADGGMAEHDYDGEMYENHTGVPEAKEAEFPTISLKSVGALRSSLGKMANGGYMSGVLPHGRGGKYNQTGDAGGMANGGTPNWEPRDMDAGIDQIGHSEYTEYQTHRLPHLNKANGGSLEFGEIPLALDAIQRNADPRELEPEASPHTALRKMADGGVAFKHGGFDRIDDAVMEAVNGSPPPESLAASPGVSQPSRVPTVSSPAPAQAGILGGGSTGSTGAPQHGAIYNAYDSAARGATDYLSRVPGAISDLFTGKFADGGDVDFDPAQDMVRRMPSPSQWGGEGRFTRDISGPTAAPDSGQVDDMGRPIPAPASSLRANTGAPNMSTPAQWGGEGRFTQDRPTGMPEREPNGSVSTVPSTFGKDTADLNAFLQGHIAAGDYEKARQGVATPQQFAAVEQGIAAHKAAQGGNDDLNGLLRGHRAQISTLRRGQDITERDMQARLGMEDQYRRDALAQASNQFGVTSRQKQEELALNRARLRGEFGGGVLGEGPGGEGGADYAPGGKIGAELARQKQQDSVALHQKRLDDTFQTDPLLGAKGPDKVEQEKFNQFFFSGGMPGGMTANQYHSLPAEKQQQIYGQALQAYKVGKRQNEGQATWGGRVTGELDPMKSESEGTDWEDMATGGMPLTDYLKSKVPGFDSGVFRSEGGRSTLRSRVGGQGFLGTGQSDEDALRAAREQARRRR